MKKLVDAGHIIVSPLKKAIMIIICLTAVIGIDRITKIAAKNHLKGQGTISVLGDIVVLRYAENRGAFLGLGSSLPERTRFYVFIILPAIVLVGVVGGLLFSRHVTGLQLIALAVVLGGGIGNLIDRIYYRGMVADFLNMGIGRIRTGIFNVADIAIMAGAVLFIVSALRKKG